MRFAHWLVSNWPFGVVLMICFGHAEWEKLRMRRWHRLASRKEFQIGYLLGRNQEILRRPMPRNEADWQDVFDSRSKE